MSSIDGLYHGSSDEHAHGAHLDYNNSNYQHPVSGQSKLPQGTQPDNDNAAFAEGCLHPMHANQSRYPMPVVYTDAHGQSWLAVPLRQGSPQFASLVPPGSAPLNRHKRSNTEANAIWLPWQRHQVPGRVNLAWISCINLSSKLTSFTQLALYLTNIDLSRPVQISEEGRISNLYLQHLSQFKRRSKWWEMWLSR